jgi:catechol 2,3-dioxygenase-like lactoylglutathione lyase family enzyme
MANGTTISLPGKIDGKITPAYLAHIVLRTANYRPLVEWYKTVLNANVTHENATLTFLTFDEEHHRIAIANMPVFGKRSKNRAGLDHVAFTYASLGDLLATHDRLHAGGIEPIWCVNHGPTLSMYSEDPDGNVVELQFENFDSIAALEAWATTSDFAENPIGVDFDPADLKRRHDAGEPETTLKVRPRIGPRSAATIPVAYLGRTGAFLLRVAKAFGKDV